MPDLTNWVAGEAAVKSAFDTSAIGASDPRPQLGLSKTGPSRSPDAAVPVRAGFCEWQGIAPSPFIVRATGVTVARKHQSDSNFRNSAKSI